MQLLDKNIGIIFTNLQETLFKCTIDGIQNVMHLGEITACIIHCSRIFIQDREKYQGTSTC